MVKLRKATLKDCKFIYDLRFSEDVVEVSTTKTIPYYHQHRIWYKKHYKFISMIMLKDKRIGYAIQEDYVSIALHFKHRGKGIGKEVISMLDGKAVILSHNYSSLNAFVQSGWKIKGFYLN